MNYFALILTFIPMVLHASPLAKSHATTAEIAKIVQQHQLRPYDPATENPAHAEPTGKVIQLAIAGIQELVQATQLKKGEEIDALLGLWAAAVEFDLGNDIAAVNDSVLLPHVAKINARIEKMEKMSRPPVDKKLLLAIAVAIASELTENPEGND